MNPDMNKYRSVYDLYQWKTLTVYQALNDHEITKCETTQIKKTNLICAKPTITPCQHAPFFGETHK